MRQTSIKIVLALVTSHEMHLEQMDVMTTFLHGDLEEQIYIKQPQGFTKGGPDQLVCKLNVWIEAVSKAMIQAV